MVGFGLLLGRLIGDYILQNDWLAANKTNPAPKGVRPCSEWFGEAGGGITPGTPEERAAWDAQAALCRKGHLACTVHCLLYTLAVWACSAS